MIHDNQSFSRKLNVYYIQLTEYETDPYFLQLNQNLTINSFLIYIFVQVVNFKFFLVLICRTEKTISGSQLVQNM
jgi:hypothetical protein